MYIYIVIIIKHTTMKPMNAILLSFFCFLASIVLNAAVILKDIDTKGMDNYLAALMAVCFVFFIGNIAFKHKLVK